jgi:hypothetical protein
MFAAFSCHFHGRSRCLRILHFYTLHLTYTLLSYYTFLDLDLDITITRYFRLWFGNFSSPTVLYPSPVQRYNDPLLQQPTLLELLGLGPRLDTRAQRFWPCRQFVLCSIMDEMDDGDTLFRLS